MSRSEYAALLAEMRVRHPWLEGEGHLLEPAPGYLGVLEQMFEQWEMLLPPAALNFSLLSVTSHNREALAVQFRSVVDLPESDICALQDTIRVARTKISEVCPICGAPVVSAREHCARHKKSKGLFTEDLRRFVRTHEKNGHPRASKKTAPSASEENPDPLAAYAHCPKIDFLDVVKLDHFAHTRIFREDKERAKRIAIQIDKAGGATRAWGVLPEKWEALLEAFKLDFPNFGELWNYLENHFFLSAMGDRRVYFPPVLLLGDPGIGKTAAARALTTEMALPFLLLDMSSAESGAALSGSEAFWSNTEHGRLFALLAGSPLANPVVMLDELDKSAGDPRFKPTASLYTLLEETSARTFTDLSIRDFAIDASHVNWITTANSADTIPDPLLSRMKVFHIPAPKPEEMPTIIQNIYRSLCKSNAWGNIFVEALDQAVVGQLVQKPPRTIRQIMQETFGAAARAKRGEIRVEDLPDLDGRDGSRHIGFM
jgi:ATP-dependent Lon protease